MTRIANPNHPRKPKMPTLRGSRLGAPWAAAILVMLFAAAASANEGVFLLGNDALQLGRASSGVASPRSSYWSYMNPAGMVDLEKRLDLNWYTVFTDVSLEPRGLLGNRLDGKLESNGIYNIGSWGMVWPLEHGVLGGGMYVPSGTGVDYPHSRTLLGRLFQGNSDRRLTYQHVRLVLAYAYEFDNGWALGFGLHTSLSRFRSDHITLGLHPAWADYEWDEALGAGFGLGLYKHWDRWAFGLNYSSRHWTQSMDEYEDLLKHPLDTPHIIQAGVAYELTPKLELTADLKYLFWKDVATYGENLYFNGGFNWSDQFGVKLGVEYDINDRWTLMAGFAHSNAPVEEDHSFLGGLVPVTVEDHLTAGVTFRINEHHELHLVGIHGFDNTIKDSGRGLREGDLLSFIGKNSEVTSNGESVVLGYTYKF